MIPVTELEMAASTTFASIVNEIQLSNLNFTIKMTPFAAYITLKKTVQKDINGVHASPAPPLLFLLHKSQEDLHSLQVENSKLKAAAESSAHEAAVLISSLEESNHAVEELNDENIILKEKIAKAEKEAFTKHAANANYEHKIREDKKKHFEELNILQSQIKTLTKENKTIVKEVHDLKRSLENTRNTLKSCKVEKSQLKINKTKLEAEIRKSEHRGKKERKETGAKSDNRDINANVEVEAGNHVVTSNVSSPMDIISLVSHVVPNIHAASDRPINNEQLETIEAKGIELEVKEDGFIGPRLPRVMTKEEVRALFRELFPNSDKYK